MSTIKWGGGLAHGCRARARVLGRLDQGPASADHPASRLPASEARRLADVSFVRQVLGHGSAYTETNPSPCAGSPNGATPERHPASPRRIRCSEIRSEGRFQRHSWSRSTDLGKMRPCTSRGSIIAIAHPAPSSRQPPRFDHRAWRAHCGRSPPPLLMGRGVGFPKKIRCGSFPTEA